MILEASLLSVQSARLSGDFFNKFVAETEDLLNERPLTLVKLDIMEKLS